MARCPEIYPWGKKRGTGIFFQWQARRHPLALLEGAKLAVNNAKTFQAWADPSILHPTAFQWYSCAPRRWSCSIISYCSGHGRDMRLNHGDQTWLAAYRKQLAAEFPNVVEEFLVYGSKARGTARHDSDLDVLMIIDDHYATEKRQLRRVGYLLAAKSDVLPSILVYTRSEWAQRRATGSSFHRAVERDAIDLRGSRNRSRLHSAPSG